METAEKGRASHFNRALYVQHNELASHEVGG